jgi:NADH-quinone oxidoreductase subunit G
MATLRINGKEITVKDGTTILEAARKAGFFIPTFCYQADLVGGGMCRMCLVEIEGHPKLEPSCIFPVRDGMSVLTETAQVNRARADMLEFLLANHGLDCPVCDKGGECELQDLVYKYGPHKGRYAEQKYRWHEKDYVISPVIIKNSNRCVQCMKCVRVCREVVGQNVLDGLYRGDKQEETSFFRSILDCDQDGNCIEVCPVGCYMRLPWRYESRPWDQKTADTICPYCGTGCRMVIEERDGKVNRSRAQLGVGINSETLCARGRFGYDVIHHPERLTTPLLKKNGRLEPAPWEGALAAVSSRLQASDPSKIGGIASARLTNEELFLFQKLFREALKSGNIDSSTRWDPAAVKGFIFASGMTEGGVSIFDCMKAGTVFIVGTYLSDENPVTDYMVRRMARENRTGVVIASPRAMKLDSSALFSLRHLPGAEKELLEALSLSIGMKKADALSGHPGWDSMRDGRIETLLDHAGLKGDALDRLAGRMDESSSVGIIAGTEFLRFPQGISALATFVHVLKTLDKKVSIVPILDRCNQRGAWEMGVLPGFGPGYRNQKQAGLGYRQMLEAAERGELESLYLIGEDPAATHPDRAFVRKALSNVKFLIVQDIYYTETAKLADCVLPGACFAEKEGTFTNQEGRVQPISRLRKPPGQAKSDLVIFGEIGRRFETAFAPKTRRFLPVFQEIRKTVGMYEEVSLAFVNRRNEMNDLDNRASLLKDSGIRGTAEPLGSAPKPLVGDGGDEEGLFILTTGNHLFHSGRFSRRSDILNSLLKDPVVEISDEDAASLGLSSGQKVRVAGRRHQAVLTLKTRRGSKKRVAFIAENFEEIAVNRFFEEGGFTAKVRIAGA